MGSLVKFVQMCDALNLFIIKWCGRFATFLLALMTCVVFFGVVLRLGFHSPFAWTDEFAKYCMVWLTFIGAPVVMVKASHVTVDMLHKYLPEFWLHVVHLAIGLFCCVILFLFVKYGWTASLSAQRQSIVVMNHMSMFWVYVSIPLGSAIFLFAQIVAVLKEILALFHLEQKGTVSC